MEKLVFSDLGDTECCKCRLRRDAGKNTSASSQVPVADEAQGSVTPTGASPASPILSRCASAVAAELLQQRDVVPPPSPLPSTFRKELPEEFEHRDPFVDEEDSDDDNVRTSNDHLSESMQQASACLTGAPAATEAAPADDAVASAAAIASASRVSNALPAEISDFQSCASSVNMPHGG